MPHMRLERCLRWNRYFHMEAPNKYREFADECDQLAKRTKALQQRRILEEMARVWRQLAEETDAK
jgi:hypothetical protein